MSEELTFSTLITGPVHVHTTIPLAAGQTVQRGDLLECVVTSGVPANTFSKASAAAKAGNLYMIAAEDVTTGESAGTICAYGAGNYNIDAVGLTGDQTVNKLVLLLQGIVLETVKSGENV